MKKIDLGQTISVLANLGVIAGIVFLAIELRQNNELLTAQASFSQFSVERARRERMMTNAGGITDVVVKARNDAPLTEVERIQVNLFFNDLLDSWRWQHRELQADRLPDDYIDLRVWRGMWNGAPGVQRLFEETKGDLEPDFVQYVEENIIGR